MFPQETLNLGLHPGKTLSLTKTVPDSDCYREPLQITGTAAREPGAAGGA